MPGTCCLTGPCFFVCGSGMQGLGHFPAGLPMIQPFHEHGHGLMRAYRRDPRELVFLILLLGIFAGGQYLLSLHKQTNLSDVPDSSQHQDVIRVLAPGMDPVIGSLSPYGPGIERELLEDFARSAGFTIQWLPPCGHAAAWKALEHGRADLVIGQGTSRNPRRKDIVSGPIYAHMRPLLVQAQLMENGRRATTKHVLLPSNPLMQNALSNLMSEIPASAITRVPHKLGYASMLKSLDSNTAPLAVFPDLRFQLVNPFFLDLTPVQILDGDIPCRWFWRTTNKRMANALDVFWKADTTPKLISELRERYLGFFPNKTPYYELRSFYSVLETELPKFSHLIVDQTTKQSIDPLFFSALIYQESRFNPDARSRTGAKGLLQFTSVAAEHFNLEDPYDPSESIRAGCDYLNASYKRLEPLGLDTWDRLFFTLAAYNQGHGHLQDAIELARHFGMEGRTWREIRQVFPLLEQKRYGKMVTYGTCRGGEAVRFVDRVRYYYYVLYGLVRLSRPEAQHLGPLFDSLSGGSLAIGGATPAVRPVS